MRLLHTRTLQVIHFVETSRNESQLGAELNSHSTLSVPRYAILSHTWEDSEVTFQDMTSADDPDLEEAKKKAGFGKIEKSCELARKAGIEYIWIDTCCIDKTNSTELFEAINSMFMWYRNAWICYVYLSDAGGSSPVYSNPRQDYWHLFKWYRRGWTLQELVASRHIAFYGSGWGPLGTKEEHLLLIAKATGIDAAILAAGDDLEAHLARISVARRMHWLAYRETTRPEDMAYCMLGIFGISMPVLYGEGDRAFLRLQEEILKTVDDQSLFAWKEDDSLDYYRADYGDSFRRWGLLARSAADFRVAASVARFRDTRASRPAIHTTSRGVQTTLLMCEDRSYETGDIFLAVLNCHVGHIPGVYAGIRLKRMTSTDEYVRIDTPQLFSFCVVDATGQQDLGGFDLTQEQDVLYELRLRIAHRNWAPRTVFVKQDIPAALPPGLWLVPPPASVRAAGHAGRVVVYDVVPKDQWDAATWTVQPTAASVDYWTGFSAAFSVGFGGHTNADALVIVAGARPIHSGGIHPWEPWCKVLPRSLCRDLTGFVKKDGVAANTPDFSQDLGVVSTIERTMLYGQDMFLIKLCPIVGR
ncbi:hypothetical protein SEUCBS140593_006806 [Sporothrix eucalyptigena]|uniref:Heterokaryon incompatibility domain-containing protein n=1 Tax=Sporothrix eucalyptigena TaxID=1812306 RepID=A0ABP0C869_9PEZI